VYECLVVRFSGIAALIGLLLLLLLLLFFTRFKYRRALLAVVAIAVVVAVVVMIYVSRTSAVSTTVVQLEPGKVYFWKVVAEDGEGGTVESPTRRFTVR